MGKMLGRAFLCAVAGLLAWVMTEPFLSTAPLTEAWRQAEQTMVIVVIGCIGLVAGFHQGFLKGGAKNMGLGSALGVVFGLIGGYGGYLVGGGMANALFGSSWSMGPFPIIPRAMVFSLLGAGLGLAIGFTQFKVRTTLAGGFGGLVGGMISGLAFDIIGKAVTPFMMIGNPGQAEVGGPGRAIFWTILGLTIGLFTAWLEQATRQAWVRLILGRNEGKEWPIDGIQTHLGRDERASVPLFGDHNVAPLHATITRQGNQYILSDAGSPVGTGYQGQQLMQPVALQPGDTFQIGGHQLQFLVKASEARKIHEGRAHAVQTGQPQQPLKPIQSNPNPAPTQFNQTVATPAQQANPTIMAAPAAGFALVALDGPLTGQRIAVVSVLEAGRETPGINLSFDAQASRRHAVITPSPHGIHVKDLGSTNGTFLNGQQIPEANAPVGSVIKIGSTSFRVEAN